MAALRHIVLVVLALIAMVSCNPIPGFGGGGKHEHYVIHVPYHVHTVHHHHVKKIPIYVKEHHHHYDHHHDHHIYEHDHHHGYHGWD